MSDRLQEGIYFRSCEKPGQAWRLLLLNIKEGASREEVFEALKVLWEMLQNLKSGRTEDLKPVCVPVDGNNLTCLIGYGSRLFDLPAHKPLIEQGLRPAFPTDFSLDRQPFNGIPWVSNKKRRPSSADIGLQFIAQTELAVNRAIVETHKWISDKRLPLRIVHFFSGFARDDRRSWIDFHDGINSMSPEERIAAIEIKESAKPLWMSHGTFMAFLRLEINLQRWRKLSREHQELLVGRDKLSGCPLVSTEKTCQGKLVIKTMPNCPFTGNFPQEYIDPSRPSGDSVLLFSHIHRANLNRGSPVASDSSNRIYRQSYEFLEVCPGGKLSLGLNFVSFQADANRIGRILNLKSWLGNVNFGGINPSSTNTSPAAAAAPDVPFLSLISGLYFATPPNSEPFPGHEIFV